MNEVNLVFTPLMSVLSQPQIALSMRSLQQEAMLRIRDSVTYCRKRSGETWKREAFRYDRVVSLPSTVSVELTILAVPDTGGVSTRAGARNQLDIADTVIFHGQDWTSGLTLDVYYMDS